jgi:hypothetical protein
MVKHDSLRKRAASQPTQPPQLTKRNAVVPLHTGLRAVLARCPPLLPSSGREDEDKDEDEDEDKGEGEEEEEAQELDVDLDQDEDDKDDDDAGLVGPNIQQPTQEPPDKEIGFRTASGRII